MQIKCQGLKILLVLFITLALIGFFLFPTNSREELSFRAHLGMVPSSVNNIIIDGGTSLAGSRVEMWFDINSRDLEQLIIGNKFVKMPDNFLSGTEISMLEDGSLIEIQRFDYYINRSKLAEGDTVYFYIKEGSTYISTYHLLIVNSRRSKVYYLYNKY